MGSDASTEAGLPAHPSYRVPFRCGGGRGLASGTTRPHDARMGGLFDFPDRYSSQCPKGTTSACALPPVQLDMPLVPSLGTLVGVAAAALRLSCPMPAGMGLLGRSFVLGGIQCPASGWKGDLGILVRYILTHREISQSRLCPASQGMHARLTCCRACLFKVSRAI